MTKTIYEVPMVSVEVISIEHGLAQSNLGGQTRLAPQSEKMRITTTTFKQQK